MSAKCNTLTPVQRGMTTLQLQRSLLAAQLLVWALGRGATADQTSTAYPQGKEYKWPPASLHDA